MNLPNLDRQAIADAATAYDAAVAEFSDVEKEMGRLIARRQEIVERWSRLREDIERILGEFAANNAITGPSAVEVNGFIYCFTPGVVHYTRYPKVS